MGTAGSLIDRKRQQDDRLVTIKPESTAYDAACLMNHQRIGALIVLDDDENMVGIFTERDLLRRVIAEDLNPRKTPIRDVMTRNVIICEPSTLLDELRLLMRQKRIRHVPVVDNGRVLGMISIGDLNIAHAAELSETIMYLEQYVSPA